MKIPASMPRLKGFRHAREIIAYAVWTYHRFALSLADVDDRLAERGVIVSRETIRLWVNRFGAYFAACIRADRPQPNDTWHLDEVVIPINGVKHWLWRAVDAASDVLDILVHTCRNTKAPKHFLAKLIAQFGHPRVAITDKLRSHTKPIDHRAHQGLNNRIEGNHRPTRRREKIMGASNPPDKHNDFSLPTTRSTPSSVPAAIASLPNSTAMLGPTHSVYGPPMPPRWLPEFDCRATSKSAKTTWKCRSN